MKPIINVDASKCRSGDAVTVLVYISNKFEVPLNYTGPKVVNERQKRAVGLIPELGYDTFIHLKGNGGKLNVEVIVNDEDQTYYEIVDSELLDVFKGR